MANAVVKVNDVSRGLLTSEDKAVFSNVSIGMSDEGEVIIKLDYTNSSYFLSWVDRDGGEVIGDSKPKIRYLVCMDVGDCKDRLADSFKFIQFLMLAVSNLYSVQSQDTKDNMDGDIIDTLDNFLTIRAENDELFNIDLKESLSTEINDKLVMREKKVKDIIKATGSI